MEEAVRFQEVYFEMTGRLQHYFEAAVVAVAAELALLVLAIQPKILENGRVGLVLYIKFID